MRFGFWFFGQTVTISESKVCHSNWIQIPSNVTCVKTSRWMLGGWLSDCPRYDTEHDQDNFRKNRTFNGKPTTSIHLVSGFSSQVQSDFKEFSYASKSKISREEFFHSKKGWTKIPPAIGQSTSWNQRVLFENLPKQQHWRRGVLFEIEPKSWNLTES